MSKEMPVFKGLEPMFWFCMMKRLPRNTLNSAFIKNGMVIFERWESIFGLVWLVEYSETYLILL